MKLSTITSKTCYTIITYCFQFLFVAESFFFSFLQLWTGLLILLMYFLYIFNTFLFPIKLKRKKGFECVNHILFCLMCQGFHQEQEVYGKVPGLEDKIVEQFTAIWSFKNVITFHSNISRKVKVKRVISTSILPLFSQPTCQSIYLSLLKTPLIAL